ncbi:MAG: FAD-dependent thymidylate synthase [Planctomycetes bacterium]|nr:FAD-dependent thymidylate synthase [Planctomycetota bacterium]
MPESPLVDVMGGATRREIRVLDHGFIALLDAMPRLVPEGQTADAAIVQAARVSYGQGTKKVSEDRGLIRFLMRHRHTTPFEMIEFKFHVAVPIFIARQWIRHRTANVNEYSGRYSIMPDTFYRPTADAVRKQSAGNRQGGAQTFGAKGAKAPGHEAAPEIEGPDESMTAQAFLDFLDKAESNYPEYLSLTERGVSRELARIGLPLSLYTQWYWKCDLHNILGFLSLRMDSHSQLEIRAYAQAMHDLIEPIVPVAMEAWRDYDTNAMRLTRLEIEAIRNLKAGGDGSLDTTNKREQSEWAQKRSTLGL